MNPRNALEAAQEIVDMIAQDCPDYRDKKVSYLTVSPPTRALEVTIHHTDGTTLKVTGLWAHEIDRHLALP